MLAIASEATQEAALESLLSGIQSKWASMEFKVSQYKNQRDVYILDGFDDIVTLLEDSNVSMMAAMSDRYGPLAHEGCGLACKVLFEQNSIG